MLLPQGVTAVPQEGRGIYLWNARIAGLAGTEWDGKWVCARLDVNVMATYTRPTLG